MNFERLAGFDRLPRMSCRSYAHELGAAMFMPAAIACVESGVVGVIARLGFGRHHDVVKGGLATVYMGVHVTLTGIRGLFAPFLGPCCTRGGSCR